ENVAANREIAMASLGLPVDRLVTLRQIHSATVVTVEQPWRREDSPSADGLVTAVPGIALAVLAADCAPVLFYDPVARVIGAVHGGWRGALGGVVDATVARMAELGADRRHIRAAIGPCIAQPSYEVGPEFPQRFIAEDPGNIGFFAPARAVGRFLFDLGGDIAHRLLRAGGVGAGALPPHTGGDEQRVFCSRRACLRGGRCLRRALPATVLH